MNGFNKCVNGHFFKEGLTKCPYCPSYDFVDMDRMPIPEIYAEENVGKLLTSSNSIFKFDNAPDGIKRYLKSRRKDRDLVTKSDVNSYLNFISSLEIDEIYGEIEILQNKLDVFFLRKNIHNLNFPELNLIDLHYIIPSKMKNFFPRTILATILNNYRNENIAWAQTGTFGNNSVDAHIFEKVAKELDFDKFIAINVNDLSNMVISSSLNTDFTEISKATEYQEENISCLNPIVKTQYNNLINQYEYSFENYKNDLIELKNNKLTSISFIVKAQNIVQSFSTMINQLSEMHDRNIMHTDIKPENILCTHEGFKLIDSMNVINEDISIGITPNHCSPEQILGLPITPASDIYNLGLIILKIVGAKLYGKTSNYIIPIGRNSTESVNIISEPNIYIDSQTSHVKTVEGRDAWRNFLEKCLAFQSKKRYNSMNDFQLDFENLLTNFPLEKDFEFSANFGHLENVNESGSREIAWVLSC
jgi:hypothetical protein